MANLVPGQEPAYLSSLYWHVSRNITVDTQQGIHTRGYTGKLQLCICRSSRSSLLSCEFSSLTIAMQQYTRDVLATDTKNKLLLFQLRPLEYGTVTKAGTARRQPIRCQFVIPNILITRGNMASCEAAPIKPAVIKTCERD